MVILKKRRETTQDIEKALAENNPGGGYQVKKVFLILSVVSMLMLLPATALGINSPAVSTNHGAVTGMFISDIGLSIGAEYGFTGEWGAHLRIWEDAWKIGAKFELNPNLAIVGGVFDENPYLGVNGSFGINRNFQGLYEADLYMESGDFMALYELGVKLNLAKGIDIRGGLLGFLGGGDSDLYFQLGLGYRF